MKLSPSNLLTFFVLTYYILNIIFPQRNPLVEESRIFPQTIMALICIYCLWVSINKCRIIIEERAFRFFFLIMMMGLLYSFIDKGTNVFKNVLDFLKGYMAIMFMFTLYVHLHQDEKMAKRNIYIIFCMQVIYVFYLLWLDRTMGYGIDAKEKVFDSNSGFLFECCIPMSLILPIKRLRLYIYLMLFVGCVYSGQRSAALAVILSLPLSLHYLLQDIKKNDIIILSILLVVAIIPILNIAIENLITRHNLDVAKKSMGSGRSIFWAIVWRHFWHNDLIYILFGNGYGSVQKLLKRTYGMAILSHNGWLDYMYIYGVGGLLVYAKSLLSILTNNKRINEGISEYKNIFLIIFVLFIVKCTTSHGNWDISVMPIAMTMAIILYDYKKETELHTNNETETITQYDTIES